MTTDTTPAEDKRHHEPDGVFLRSVYTFSMLFGRGGMARKVAEIADLSASDVVVDLGCGPGTAVRQARRGGAARAVGIDPSPQMLRLARWMTTLRHMDGVDFLEGTAESIPLEAQSATVVWAVQSVHHWENPDRGLKESLRVLAPGGRLVLAEKSVVPGARGHAQHGLTERQADELVRLLVETGFVHVTKHAVRAGRRRLVAVTANAASSETVEGGGN